ncbi:hypothetical protein F4804DRAFT_334778 [Jackrogersella minutella]|nr:hypothetical protein F4804DRAFT_334778 [Jackrogersella minutella]
MGAPTKQQAAQPPVASPRRDDDVVDTHMTDASPSVNPSTPDRSPSERTASQEPAHNTPVRGEYIATPRSARSSSVGSTSQVAPTPGMAPRERFSSTISRPLNPLAMSFIPRSVPGGTGPATPVRGHGLSATPQGSALLTPTVSSFRTSVLAGERPAPATPAQAVITADKVPEPGRRRSNRVLPPGEHGRPISPTNPTHRRASALFRPSTLADEDNGDPKPLTKTDLQVSQQENGKDKDEGGDKDKENEK